MNPFAMLFGERHSLRRNLVFNIILALIFCIALASAIMIREFFEHLQENVQGALTREAQEVIGQIDPARPGFGLDTDALRFRGDEGAYRYTVFDDRLDVVAGGETSVAIATQMAALNGDGSTSVRLPGDRIGVGLRATVDGQNLYVLTSTHPKISAENQIQTLYYEIKEEIQWVILGIFAILTAALLATRRSLRPLNLISQQAHDIGPNAADRRLSSDRLPSEIVPLVGAVNGAFDRLEQGYRAQRDFSSNVAHEVRTPLAILRSSIDQIEDPELRAELRQDANRLDQMFEQLIDLSRAEALGTSSFEPVNLHSMAVDLASTMASQSIRKGISLAVTGVQDSPVDGHPGLLSIALSNLMRNALAYSPPGTEVEIEVLSNPSGWRVLDHGPGVADAQKTVLFERFHRGAASEQGPIGSGIGLAIVKSVADAHGARARIEDRPGGGSAFVFEFAATSDPGPTKPTSDPQATFIPAKA